jgi:hypothetical protein
MPGASAMRISSFLYEGGVDSPFSMALLKIAANQGERREPAPVVRAANQAPVAFNRNETLRLWR